MQNSSQSREPINGAAERFSLPSPQKTRAAIIAIAMVAGFAELAYAVMNVSAMPVYLKFKMGYGADWVAGIGTAFLICEGVMKGPFGVLGDRIGRKTLMIVGPLVSVFTSLLTLLLSPNHWHLFILLRILDGLGAAALWPSALAMIADVVDENRRSQAMSLFNVTYLIGIALGPLIGGVANELPGFLHGNNGAVDYSASFYLVSGLFLLTALAAWVMVPNVKPIASEHPHAPLEGISLKAVVDSVKQAPQIMLMALVTFAGVGMVMLMIKLFALDEFHVTETQFGASLLIPCVFIGITSIPLGTLGDRIGHVRAVRLGLGLCAVAMFTILFIREQLLLMAAGSFIGIGFVIAFPAWMAYISTSCDPRKRGAIMGTFGTAQGLGAMMGAPIGGFLYQYAPLTNGMIPFAPWINRHYTPFIGCAFLLLTSWAIAMFMVKEKKAPNLVETS